MARGNTWSNDDGLDVGFGTHEPSLLEGETKGVQGGGVKQKLINFDWNDLNAGSDLFIGVEANSHILDVLITVDETFTSTGTNTMSAGDGSDDDGFILAALATVADMVAGAKFHATGAYTVGTGATDRELKKYTAADNIEFISAQTDWLSGKGTCKVVYI